MDICSGEQGRDQFSLFISLAGWVSTHVCYRGLSSMSRSWRSLFIFLDMQAFIVHFRRLRLGWAGSLVSLRASPQPLKELSGKGEKESVWQNDCLGQMT